MSLDDKMKALSLNERLTLLETIKKETEMVTKLWKYDGPLSYTFRKVRFLTDETTLEGLKEFVTSQYLSGLLGKITGPLEFKPIDSEVYDVVVSESELAKLEKKLELQLLEEHKKIQIALENQMIAIKEDAKKRLFIISEKLDQLEESDETEGSTGIPSPHDTYTAYASWRLDKMVEIRTTDLYFKDFESIGSIDYDDCNTPKEIGERFTKEMKLFDDLSSKNNLLAEPTSQRTRILELYPKAIKNAACLRMQWLWDRFKNSTQKPFDDVYLMYKDLKESSDLLADVYGYHGICEERLMYFELLFLTHHAMDWVPLFILLESEHFPSEKANKISNPFAGDEMILLLNVISVFCAEINLHINDKVTLAWTQLRDVLQKRIIHLISQSKQRIQCDRSEEMDFFIACRSDLIVISEINILQPSGKHSKKIINTNIDGQPFSLKLDGSTKLYPLQSNARNEYENFIKRMNIQASDAPKKKPPPQSVIEKLSAQVQVVDISQKIKENVIVDSFLLNNLLDTHYRIMYLSLSAEPQPIFIDTYTKLNTYMNNRPEMFVTFKTDEIRDTIPSKWSDLFKQRRNDMWKLIGRNHSKSLDLTTEQKNHPEIRLLPAITKAILFVFNGVVNDNDFILERINTVPIVPKIHASMELKESDIPVVDEFSRQANAIDINDFFGMLGGRFLSSFITWDFFNGATKKRIVNFKSLDLPEQGDCLFHAWDYVYPKIYNHELSRLHRQDLKFASFTFQSEGAKKYHHCVLMFQEFIARNDLYLNSIVEKDNKDDFNYLFTVATQMCTIKKDFPMKLHPIFLMICKLPVPPRHEFGELDIEQFGWLMIKWDDDQNFSRDINEAPSLIWKIFRMFEMNHYSKSEKYSALSEDQLITGVLTSILKKRGDHVLKNVFKSRDDGLSYSWRMVFDLVTIGIFGIGEKRSNEGEFICSIGGKMLEQLIGSLHGNNGHGLLDQVLFRTPYVFDFINVFTYLVYSRHAYILNPANESKITSSMMMIKPVYVNGVKKHEAQLSVFDEETKRITGGKPIVQIRKYCQAKKDIIQQYWMPKIDECLLQKETKEFIQLIRWCKQRIESAYTDEWLTEWKINLRTDRQVLEAYLVLFDDYRIWSDHSEFSRLIHVITKPSTMLPILEISTLTESLSFYFGEFFNFVKLKDLKLSQLKNIFPLYDPVTILEDYSSVYENAVHDKIVLKEDKIIEDQVIEDKIIEE